MRYISANKKRRKNRKGISILVSYVLLVTLAIALASMTYVFLKQYAEKPFPEESCPEGTNIIIENYDCDSDTNIINITIKNRGLHSVDGILIKISNSSDEFLYDFWEISPDCSGRTKCTVCEKEPCFDPGDEEFDLLTVSYKLYGKIIKIVIIPYKKGDQYYNLCENAISSLDIEGCD